MAAGSVTCPCPLRECVFLEYDRVVDPCTNEASDPGLQNPAEWLRLGFHNMATADAAAGTGGLDNSSSSAISCPVFCC